MVTNGDNHFSTLGLNVGRDKLRSSETRKTFVPEGLRWKHIKVPLGKRRKTSLIGYEEIPFTYVDTPVHPYSNSNIVLLFTCRLREGSTFVLKTSTLLVKKFLV